ncbi:MAG: hypothetical protein NDI94_04030 [Candidatus Woesearchaeota archaeon]|nr:hypothetical protein [Candidatus Woesearchaeota archaeon]
MKFTRLIRVFLILSLISLLMIFTYIDISNEKAEGIGLYRFLQPYHAEIMLFLAILGITTGAVTYSFMEIKIEKTLDQGHVSTSLLLKLLEPNQRKIIAYLWEQGGRTNQFELSRIDSLDKLKVHRALRSLQERGIITIEHHGKINKVTLQKDILAVGTKKPVP